MDSSIKINWLDKKVWKQSVISTLICLLGCTIGVMGTTFYLINYDLVFVLVASLIAGFISCMTFMVAWEVIFHKMNLTDAIKHSYKMSLVSILIMIISENIIMLLILPKFSPHQMHMNTGHGLGIMLFAMSFGFLLSLPYNYYHLQKTGKTCY